MSMWKYSLIVFLGGCSYGVVSTFVKLSYKGGFVANEITGAQYFFGAILLWVTALFIAKIKLEFKQLIIIMLSGTPMGLTGFFYNHCLEYINASFAIILLLQFTWISVMLQFIFDKKIPDRKNVTAIGIILFGSILASGVFRNSVTFSFIGIGWGLLAATSFSTFIFISGRNSANVHPILKSAIMATGAVLVVFILMPPTFLFNGALVHGLFKYGIFIGFFGLLLPAILFNIGMPKVGGLGSILSASELPMAVIMSTLVLHETVSLLQWVGVIVILVGIAFPNIIKKQLQISNEVNC